MTDLSQLVQGTDEWRIARCGSLGASHVPRALAKTKTGWGASRTALIAELACEQLTGKPWEYYQTLDMRNGTEREPIALANYIFQFGCTVTQVGLIPHPRIKGTHASPDGLVSDDGLVEIKCPNQGTHWENLGGAAIANRLQPVWQMACTGRKWCDLISFHPDFPVEMQMVVQRIARDDDEIAKVEREVEGFLLELESQLAFRRSRYMVSEAA